MKNLIKLTAVSAVAGISTIIFATSTYALTPNAVRSTLREEIRQENMNLKNSATGAGQTIRQEIRQEVQNLKPGIINTIKEKIKSLLPRRIHGKLTNIDGQTLIVQTEKATYVVYVTSATQLRRRFGAPSSLSEFAVGDELAVIGTVHGATSDSSSSSAGNDTSIDARYIRDISIQRRATVFVGTITSIGSNTFTVQTVSRGTQTVYVDDATVYTERNATIKFTDLAVGNRVVVKGELWDRALNKIDAKRVMRLPLVPTPAANGQSSSQSSI